MFQQIFINFSRPKKCTNMCYSERSQKELYNSNTYIIIIINKKKIHKNQHFIIKKQKFFRMSGNNLTNNVLVIFAVGAINENMC